MTPELLRPRPPRRGRVGFPAPATRHVAVGIRDEQRHDHVLDERIREIEDRVERA